ncbi:MAG TPA: histidine kinase, partial [Acidimicrobiales bacterium]|nr:histidine kinase [Acidimicrobiales bacterium]
MGLATQLRAQLGTRTERMLSVARLAALAGLLWASAHQRPPSGVSVNHPIKSALMVGAGIGWLGWMASRRRGAPDRTTWCFLALLAASGGALAALAPIAITFMAVAGLAAAIAFEGLPAAGVGAIGVGALVVATSALGSPTVLIAEGAVSVAVGLMVGASRRQYAQRTLQAEQLLAERVRADAERDRAAALAERNRIGREVHDVLAHSLGALSVQLDAADALLEGGNDSTRARELVQRARRLAVQGLEETRQAVHALRDEPVALAEQLASLAARDDAELVVTGAPRPLAADAGLALYRAAQEAVTNASKHAPGAQVSIHLDFDVHSTTLT